VESFAFPRIRAFSPHMDATGLAEVLVRSLRIWIIVAETIAT